jgi:hypothetical protein
MAANSHRTPWSYHHNNSYLSLVEQGMEVVLPPGVSAPVSIRHYMSKELPAIPGAIQGRNGKKEYSSNKVSKGPNTRQSAEATHSYGLCSEALPRPLSASRRRSSPGPRPRVLPPPSSPPMSKSSQKILQLTGYDPWFEMTTPKLHAPDSIYTDSSNSSSVYSQPEEGSVDLDDIIRDYYCIAPAGRGEIYPDPLTYGASEPSGSRSDAALKERKPSNFTNHGSSARQEHHTKPCTKTNLDEHAIQELIAHERKRYEEGFGRPAGHSVDNQVVHNIDRALMPPPLAIRTKAKNPKDLRIEKPSFFADVRDSMAWGIREVTTPTRSSAPGDSHKNASFPPAAPKRKRDLSSGKHPVKSSFPFPRTRNNPESPDAEDGLAKRLSGAMRRLSGAKSPTTSRRNVVIHDSARAAEGPDTPMPGKSGFMSGLTSADMSGVLHTGNEHLQEVVAKAKQSLKITTAADRRRESLKRKIVVMGITDRSPGKPSSLPAGQ